MLNTLLKIGEWQSEGKSKWDRFLEKPKIQNSLTHYILDCAHNKIIQ
jgi:CRISPR-associated protein Csh1